MHGQAARVSGASSSAVDPGTGDRDAGGAGEEGGAGFGAGDEGGAGLGAGDEGGAESGAGDEGGAGGGGDGGAACAQGAAGGGADVEKDKDGDQAGTLWSDISVCSDN